MDTLPIIIAVVLATTLAIGSISLLSGHKNVLISIGQCPCSEAKFCERIKDTTRKEVCGVFSSLF
jgi:hypothetical protein